VSRYKVKRKSNPKKELKREAKKVNWRLVLITLITVLLVFTVYQTALHLMFEYIIHIYSISAGILTVIFGIMNRGFSKFDPDEAVFPDSLSEEEKKEAVIKEEKRRKAARKLLIPLTAILITLALDMVYLFYLEPIMK